MKGLVQLYRDLGFGNVQSYIQSGNVVFTTGNNNMAELSRKIEATIQQQFGFEVQVLVKTPLAFNQIIQQNPFAVERTFVTFLFKLPPIIPVDDLNKAMQPDDEWVVVGDMVYFCCPQSYGKSKLSNNFLETKLKVPATTRNWKTVKQLFELASQ